jgi:hypothetical protein
MSSFPNAKIHRPSRTRLSKGQSLQQQPVQITATASGATVTLAFSLPVVVRGDIPLNLSGGQTLVSQTVVTLQEIQQTYSAAVGASTWSIPANTPQIATFQGGGNAPAGGTF